MELEGLDLVEYGTLVYPEMGVVKEQIVEPDGTLVTTLVTVRATNGTPTRRAVEELTMLTRNAPRHHARRRRRVRALGRARQRRRDLREEPMPAIIDSAPDCITSVERRPAG